MTIHLTSTWLRRTNFAVIGLMEFVRGGLFLVLLPTHLREQLHQSLGTVGFVLSAFALTELSLKTASQERCEVSE